MTLQLEALAAIADLELVSKRVVDGNDLGPASESLPRLQRGVQPVPALPPRRHLKYIDWKLFRADRSPLHTKQFRETTILSAR